MFSHRVAVGKIRSLLQAVEHRGVSIVSDSTVLTRYRLVLATVPAGTGRQPAPKPRSIRCKSGSSELFRIKLCEG